jgi:GTPase SAR1 family protein
MKTLMPAVWMENIERVCPYSNFEVSLDDVVRSRAPKTGIVEVDLKFKDDDFLVIDTGGQRNERKKWIHTFDNAKGLVFVVSLVSYRSCLYEDESQNALIESLQLFEDIVNLDYFTKSKIFLVFNKLDVLEERIKIIPLTKAFPDYVGSQESQMCLQFMKNPQKETQVFWITANELPTVQGAFESIMSIVADKN